MYSQLLDRWTRGKSKHADAVRPGHDLDHTTILKNIPSLQLSQRSKCTEGFLAECTFVPEMRSWLLSKVYGRSKKLGSPKRSVSH